jgi:hypothetical protein
MQVAQSGTPGPVFVEFPIDTLYPYPLVKKEVGLKVRLTDNDQGPRNWWGNGGMCLPPPTLFKSEKSALFAGKKVPFSQ